MKRLAASDTSALWTAVGQKPYDRAIQTMISDGWVTVAINSEIGEIIMKRGEKTATLFLHKDEIGMVSVHTLSPSDDQSV